LGSGTAIRTSLGSIELRGTISQFDPILCNVTRAPCSRRCYHHHYNQPYQLQSLGCVTFTTPGANSSLFLTSRNRSYTMAPQQQRHNSTAAGEGKQGGAAKKEKKAPGPLRPSSSILLLSPTNQVLLLHRVRTSTSFASAHVFPGGNLSSFHEGSLGVPTPDSEAMHVDGPAYRLAAVRETFEESGILLAKDKQGRLLELDEETRENGRRQTHGNKIKFGDWLESVGGVPDTGKQALLNLLLISNKQHGN